MRSNRSDDEYLKQRQELVSELELYGINDKRILSAFLKVPRHLFVPPEYRVHAYENRPLPIGFGQTISQPLMIAIMLSALNLSENHRVLEIGTGSGYQTALLAELVSQVYTVEILPQLHKRAKNILEKFYDNVKFKLGDGWEGWEEHAPYDRILVSAALRELPEPLISQLREGGILVTPWEDEGGYQFLARYSKVGGKLMKENLGGVRFVRFLRASDVSGLVKEFDSN